MTRRIGTRMHRRIDNGRLEPAEYRVVEADMGEREIVLACPCCGGESSLSGRTIAANGALVGIFTCPVESCPCSDYLELTDAWEDVLR